MILYCCCIDADGHSLFLSYCCCRLHHQQQELDRTTQHSAAQEQSLQASLLQSQKERDQLQFELQQARSALESHVSDREYMQSEASSLQQALQRQRREAEQAQQVHDSWMTRFQAQVRSWHCCSHLQLLTDSAQDGGQKQGTNCSMCM